MILVTKMSLTVQSGAIMTRSNITWYSKHEHGGYWGRSSQFDLTKTPQLSVLVGKLRDDGGSIESILAEIDFAIMAQHGKW